MDDDISVIEFPSYFKEDLPLCEWLFNPSPGQLELSSNVLLHDFDKIQKTHRSKTVYKNIELQKEIDASKSNRKNQLESALRTRRLSEISTNKGIRYDHNNPLKRVLTIPKYLTHTTNRTTQPPPLSQQNEKHQRPRSANTTRGQQLKSTLESVHKVSVKSPDEIRVQKQLDKVRMTWDEEANLLSHTMNPNKIKSSLKGPERPSSAPPGTTTGYLRRAHARFEQRHLQDTIVKSVTPLLHRQHSGASTVVSVPSPSPSPGRAIARNDSSNRPTTTTHLSPTKAMSSLINSNPSNARKPPRLASVDEKNRHPPQLYNHTALQDTVQSCMLTSLYICAFAQGLRTKVYVNQLITQFLYHGQGPAYNLSRVLFTQQRIRYNQRLRKAITIRNNRMKLYGFFRIVLLKWKLRKKRESVTILLDFLKYLKAKSFLKASLRRLWKAVRLIQKCCTTFRVCNAARCYALGIFWSRVKRAYGGSIYPETTVLVPTKDGLSIKDRQLVMKEVLRNVRKLNCTRRTRLTALLNNSHVAFEKVNTHHARRFLHSDRTWNNHQIISATSIPNSPIDQCSSSAPSPFPFLFALKSEDNIDGSNDKILSSPSPSYSSSSSHSFARIENTTISMPLLSSPMLREPQPLQQPLGSTYSHTPLTSPVIKANGMPTSHSHRVFSNHKGRRIFNPDENASNNNDFTDMLSRVPDTLPDPVLVPQIFLADQNEYSSRFNVFLLYSNVEIISHIVDALQTWKQGNNSQETMGAAVFLNSSIKKTTKKSTLKKNEKRSSLTNSNPTISILSKDTQEIMKDAGNGQAVAVEPSAPTRHLPRNAIDRANERKLFEALELKKTIREYFYYSPSTPRIYRRKSG